jgi:pyrroline-5-carboxylate reductase
MKLAFIGAGKMAEAIIARLGRSAKITVSDIDRRRLRLLRSRYGVRPARDNRAAFAAAPVVILAVKPQNVAEVLAELSGKELRINRGKLVISIAAGIPVKYLQKKLPGCRIIRAMPNNPALVGQGITALAKGPGAGGQGAKTARTVFQAVGEVVEVPEKWLNAVTGLSGSGPAFIYLVLEALAKGGAAQGLPAKLAERLAVQTVLGAAATVKTTARAPRELREMVTSPGGTTVEGLAVLEKYKLAGAVAGAVRAAATKAKVLSAKWAR